MTRNIIHSKFGMDDINGIDDIYLRNKPHLLV